jgi:hypothetical protein
MAETDEAPAFLALWREAFEDNTSPHVAYRGRTAQKLLRSARRRGELDRALREIPRKDSLRLRTASTLASRSAWRPADLRPVVKSVHAPLAVEWIHQRLHPKVLVVLRHPYNVLAT